MDEMMSILGLLAFYQASLLVFCSTCRRGRSLSIVIHNFNTLLCNWISDFLSETHDNPLGKHQH